MLALIQRTAEKKNAIAAANLVRKDFVFVIFNTPSFCYKYTVNNKIIQSLGIIRLKCDESGILVAILCQNSLSARENHLQ